jgi:diguanylate cyclase (GGDEF)-like protein
VGHLAGDRALEIIGAALHHATRQTDIRGRIGGDEFAVILPNSASDGAKVVCDRIYRFLNDKAIAKPDGAIPVRCSIGICSLTSHDTDTTKNPMPMANRYFHVMSRRLLKKADELLYTAKKKGEKTHAENAVIDWGSYAEAMREYDTES